MEQVYRTFLVTIPFRCDIKGRSVTHIETEVTLGICDGQFHSFGDANYIELLDKSEANLPLSTDLGDLPLTVIENILSAVVDYDWDGFILEHFLCLKENEESYNESWRENT